MSTVQILNSIPQQQSNVTQYEESTLEEKKSSIESITESNQYLKGLPLALAFTGILLAVFLIALDQTILAPALPLIASDFGAISQIAWIASAYFLTQTSTLLLWGQALTIFNRKLVFMLTILIFELGSLICAVAQDTIVLILGRAIAGVGASGILICSLTIIADITPLKQRAALLGLIGAVFAISSVAGPILGGVFTTKATWRLCFWINLPFGVLSCLACFKTIPKASIAPLDDPLIVYTHAKVKRWSGGLLKELSPTSSLFKLAALDWIGSVLVLAVITSLLLALQYGGNVYPWNDPIVIGCFCSFGILAIIFVLYEWKFTGPSGILPLRLLKNRTQIGSMITAFALLFALLVGTYFIPIFYQAKGVSAEQSGISILPFMLAMVFAGPLAGIITAVTGKYKLMLVLSPFLLCIGGGLLSTINAQTSVAKLVGYQIITGLGISGFQLVIIAVQTDVENKDDIPFTTALVSFAQIIGGTIGLSVASSVFQSKLASNLQLLAPEAPFELVRNSIPAIFTLPLQLQGRVIESYVKALDTVFLTLIAAGVLASLGGLLVRNKSVIAPAKEAEVTVV